MMLRDIDQLNDAPEYGTTALDGLFVAEAALDAALKYVPYCDAHLNVWSSQFSQIILDSASQVDSIWKAAEHTRNPSSATGKRTIKDHWDEYQHLVAKQKLVFFGGANPVVIEPFSDWTQTSFQSPPWWQAYNKLKHDRFTHQSEATLSHAVNAVGGLFLAILYGGVCDLALIAAQTLDTSKSNYNPWAFTETGLLRDLPFECHSIIETRTFVHPLGVFGVDDCNLSSWWDSHSPRFNIWWAKNSRQYTRPRLPTNEA